LGLEVVNTQLRGKNVVAIRRVIQARDQRLQEGMVLKGVSSAEELIGLIRSGPFPLELEFQNLAAGGDALSDLGTTIVTPKDALELAQKTEGKNSQSSSRGFSVTTVRQSTGTCAIQSRRGDLLEINYEALYVAKDGRKVGYDASAFRGTGLPYQMVLGSGDMIPGVDQGLYEMCPGEVRLLDIPPVLGYGNRGTQVFRIPPDYVALEWKVELVSIDTNIRENSNDLTREEREARALY
jgi:FK506-binding protein 2